MENNIESLKDKVVLITGAAHRIGAMTARKLHSAGANIVLHCFSSRLAAEALQHELNTKRKKSAHLVHGDILQYDNLVNIINDSFSVWNRLDVLINNASMFYPTPVGAVDERAWDELLGSNLKAPFFLAQAAAPHLKQRNGCIINIVDIHADRPLKVYPVYSIAKAGLVMLTKAMACELGPEVRVNAVAPGAILWPQGDMDDALKQKIISRTLLKRQGDPSDIANAIYFLVKDGGYVSGQVLTVDGGRSINS